MLLADEASYGADLLADKRQFNELFDQFKSTYGKMLSADGIPALENMQLAIKNRLKTEMQEDGAHIGDVQELIALYGALFMQAGIHDQVADTSTTTSDVMR